MISSMNTEQQGNTKKNIDKLRNTVGLPLKEDRGRSWWSRSVTSVKGEPLPYLSRPSYAFWTLNSGIGVLAAALFLIVFSAWLGVYVPLSDPSAPRAMFLFFVVFGLFAFALLYGAIRRMIWEHKNGGIFKRGLGDMVAIVVGVAAAAIIISLGKQQ